jgi:hypothetical protein
MASLCLLTFVEPPDHALDEAHTAHRLSHIVRSGPFTSLRSDHGPGVGVHGHSHNKRRSVRSLRFRSVSSRQSYNDDGCSPQPVCSTRTVALSRLVLLDTLQDEAQQLEDSDDERPKGD